MRPGSSPSTAPLTRRWTPGARCAKLKFQFQRRPDGEGFDDSLLKGPISTIGEVQIEPGQSDIALDFQLPRGFTRSIRLLFDVSACAGSAEQGTVSIDDLAMIEWQTPWFAGGEKNPAASTTQATHLQLRQ